MTEDEVRRDERRKIAEWLLEDIDAISAWATDRRRTVELVAFMVRPFDVDSEAA